MKRLAALTVAAGLIALAGCHKNAVNNTAPIDNGPDVYNVSPDDLGANDMGMGNDSSMGMSGNSTSSGNASNASSNSSGHNASSNASAGNSSHAARNSH